MTRAQTIALRDYFDDVEARPINFERIATAYTNLSADERGEVDRIGDEIQYSGQLEGRGDDEGAQIVYAKADRDWAFLKAVSRRSCSMPALSPAGDKMRRTSARPRGAGRPARRRRSSVSRDDGEPGSPAVAAAADRGAPTGTWGAA